MTTEYLIIGQGISGTMLTHELQKAGLSFIVIDAPLKPSASAIASGIINPVTGRRIVETWMINDLLHAAFTAYRELENILGIKCLTETKVLDFFPTAQMRLAFTDRIKEVSRYLSLPASENDWINYLNYDLGYGIIHPAYLVDLAVLLGAYRNLLLKQGLLVEDSFDESQLVIHQDHLTYCHINAKKIIFCDGSESSKSKYFRHLPFALNKGEALIVDVPGLPRDYILKKGINIVPWQQDLFWVGASHEWKYETDTPTTVFKEKTLAQLKHFCRLPFTLVDHLSGLRPATLERRPFVGFHPLARQVGIFNGMGTKGCSLAPYFARELVDYLAKGTAISPEADITRFKNVLSRGRP